jgi:hydroxybutyrate-dimer hydrolase
MQLINNLNPGGALRDVLSVSPSTAAQDMNLDGALCLRSLLDGHDAPALALQRGQRETFRNGNLHGRPTLILQGRDDGLLPVNHTGRAYTAFNKLVERQRSELSYIEVTNAQHFDGFIGLPTVLPGFDSRYVPLHLYAIRALDLMWAHLTEGAALPPSQVVRTVARGGTPGAAPPLAESNVPPIAARPAAGDRILFGDRTLHVPE